MNQALDSFLRLLKMHTDTLSRHQVKTLRGQALSGDVEAARKGLYKLIGGSKYARE